MKFIGSEGGRVIQFVAPEEMRPQGGIFTPDAFRSLVERYRFAIAPDLSDPKADQSVQTFRTGVLTHANQQIAIREFTLFQSAIVVDGFTTEDAELFLEDVLQWSEQALGLRPMQQMPVRRYVSNVVVEFTKPVEQIIAGFNAVSELLSRTIQKRYEVSEPVKFAKLGFNCDPMKVAPNVIGTEFNIERRTGWSYEGNRFFCSGPVPTKELVQLLKEIETLLTSHS